ncbi:flippase-like domain-containing protein [Archangium lipolyticum]|uniref:flippase-like domain-containing protein n=1 Tax=Archangium lipolyticum TaxID=2970465 RepID=UPI00214A5D02|nr:flippase-like domain-containing protein [Archangium lipolyticum]
MRASPPDPSTPSARPKLQPRGVVLHAAGLLVAAACLHGAFREVDLSRAWGAVALLGPTVLLVPLPYALSATVDGVAWSRILAVLERRVAPLRLLSFRLSADALLISLPGGAFFAETLKPMLLTRRCGVPLHESVSVLAARKCLIVLGHGLFLGLGVALGWDFLVTSSQRVLGVSGLPHLAMGAALALILLAGGSAWSLGGGALAGRLGRLLERLPSRGLKRWLEGRKAGFARADGHLGRMLAPRESLLPALLYVGMWVADATETFLLLRLLGLEVGFGEALALEGIMSVLKVLVFFVPAGLGVQDAGYAAFIGGLAGPGALHLAAAFVLLKRAREVLLIAVGYGLLLSQRKARRLEMAPTA